MKASKSACRLRAGSMMVSYAFLSWASMSSAATVAWWRFEEPDTRPAAVTLSSEANSPVLDATLGANGTHLSSLVAAPYVTDGIGGAAYANTQSLLENGSDPNPISNPNAKTLLNDTFVNNSASWTWETFVYLRSSNGSIPYAMLLSDGTYDIRFDMDSNSQGLRFFSNGASVAVVDPDPDMALNAWHHLAVVATRTATAWDIEMYVDYAPVASADGVQLASVGSANYTIGAPTNPFDGHIDEMRISDTALTPDEFLHTAIPEPASLSVFAAILGLMMLRSRRRRRLVIG